VTFGFALPLYHSALGSNFTTRTPRLRRLLATSARLALGIAHAPVEEQIHISNSSSCPMYGRWQAPHSSTKSRWIFADASVHRLISDISRSWDVSAGTASSHLVT